MRTAITAALLLAAGCGEKATPDPAVHVVLQLDPSIQWRADEIREVYVEIYVTLDGAVQPIDKLLSVPDGAFEDGEADFDYEYDEGDVFDLYATAGTGEEVVARGEEYEVPVEPQELFLTLLPFTDQWTSPEAIDAEEGVDASGPRAVVDTFANVTVAWASGNDVWSNGGEFGAGWDGPAVVGGGNGPATGLRGPSVPIRDRRSIDPDRIFCAGKPARIVGSRTADRARQSTRTGWFRASGAGRPASTRSRLSRQRKPMALRVWTVALPRCGRRKQLSRLR